MVGKAEWTRGEANPCFVVTSLKPAEADARTLCERLYSARREMENRIKECQLDLSAGRASGATMRANQLRLAQLMIGAQVSRSVRCITLAMASGHPLQDAFALPLARSAAAAR